MTDGNREAPIASRLSELVRIVGLRFDEISASIERWRCHGTSAGSSTALRGLRDGEIDIVSYKVGELQSPHSEPSPASPHPGPWCRIL
jgi:hypothetical protein